jgi:cellulose synthase/poly-beta-1,6-N-acetylglucosamine synthase-like glycosyltransferase
MIFSFLLLITLLYLILICFFIYGFNKVQEQDLSTLKKAEKKFSIFIPFRNEAENLHSLLKTLINIDYPKTHFEVIFVDDESTDNSIEIINKTLVNSNIDYCIIKNKPHSNSPKKDAVTKAVSIAKYNWIITTDADCFLPEKWLTSFNQCIQEKNPKMIVAPVTFTSNGSFLDEFQYLDFLSLQGATIGGFGIDKPFLCNGANLVYQKSVFNELNGFENNKYIASGDDVFLLENFVKTYPKDVLYLKTYDAIVATKPEKNLTALIQQRVRWAAKSGNYNSWFGKLVALLVLLMNATILDAIILALINWISWNNLLLIFAIKFTVDFILLYKTSLFFKKGFCIKYYLFNAFLYSVFTVYVAFYSMLFEYKWKGRIYNK